MSGLSDAEASIALNYPIRRLLDHLIEEFEETIECGWGRLRRQPPPGPDDFGDLLGSHPLSADGM